MRRTRSASLTLLLSLPFLVSANVPLKMEFAPASPTRARCPGGQYYSYDACITCPMNHFCTDSVFHPCPEGTCAPPGSSICLPCVDGYTWPDPLAPAASNLPAMLPTDVRAKMNSVHKAGLGSGTCGHKGEESCYENGREGYRCANIMSDPTHCGGCTLLTEGTPGDGQDCTEIEGAGDVQCLRGACLIHSCGDSYEAVRDSDSRIVECRFI